MSLDSVWKKEDLFSSRASPASPLLFGKGRKLHFHFQTLKRVTGSDERLFKHKQPLGGNQTRIFEPSEKTSKGLRWTPLSLF